MNKAALTITLIALTLSLGGCTIEPVAPWERGNLAKKVMLKNPDTHHAAFEEHTYSSKEGTTGGYGLGAGGCGCN